MASSPSSSPLRKRPRLSSPTYEDEFDMLDGEDFRTLDEIEYGLSQKASTSSELTCDEASEASPQKKLLQVRAPSPEHPARRHSTSQSRDAFPSAKGCLSEKEVDEMRSPSPEVHLEKDYETWFLPSNEAIPAVFASASAFMHRKKAMEEKDGLSESFDIKDTQTTSWIVPRPDSIELAKKKLHVWEQESENETPITAVPPQTSLEDRQPFKNVQNASTNHDSPAFQQPPRPALAVEQGILNPLLSRTSAVSSIIQSSSSFGPSPSTPNRLPTQLSQTPLPPSSQKRKSLGLTPQARLFASKTKFKTPFKTEVKVNQNESKKLTHPPNIPSSTSTNPAHIPPTRTRSSPKNGSGSDLNRPNNIQPVPTRLTLATCGLTPQTYDREELDAMGVPSSLFTLGDISDFLYYRFNAFDASVVMTLGADSALEELQRAGCRLATKAWVDNHWCLILWKLGGMVCLDPEKLTLIWCWTEVMKQLRYRYDKELAGGSRPALSLITALDTSVERPLVLCVTKISWISGPDSGTESYPELELTDGWYRIRAQVDGPLARAIRRNIIRTGRKLICICSKIETPKNEPIDVLDSYGRACLSLSGNSTHLAPWHAKLGFQRTRCIASLHSLSPDGGRVAVMDIVILNVYPMAYIEFLSTANGETRVGRNEAEEANEEEKWKIKRAREASRLQEELEKKLERLESYADILERKTSVVVPLSDADSAPPHLESIADELEECDNPAFVIQNVAKEDASWLSILLRQKCAAEREQVSALIEAELETLAPPRRVHSFRILRVKDARTIKRPPARTAQLTIYDAAALQNNTDGIEFDLKEGQRYLVSNLIPKQQSAWMGTEEGAEIFLSTRKDSKWQLIQ